MQFRRIWRIDDGTLFPKGHTLLYIHANASWFLQSSLWIRWVVCQPKWENKGWYIINEDWSQKAYWPHLHSTAFSLSFKREEQVSHDAKSDWSHLRNYICQTVRKSTVLLILLYSIKIEGWRSRKRFLKALRISILNKMLRHTV